MNDNKLIKREEYADCIGRLIAKAFKKNPFDLVCCLLRVAGCQDEKWDPFEESLASFEDYNWMLKNAKDAPTKNAHWRIGLLTYCQAVEMTAVHEMLANFLRILNGEKYQIKPLGQLGQSNKKRLFSWIPPSANRKFAYLKEEARKCNEVKLCNYIDSFFNDKVRNAFVHSDYIITDKYFRWTETGNPTQIELSELDILISNAQEFYSAFWACYLQNLEFLGKIKKYHKWPNYEVLELLSNEKGLYGFNVHFSNGTKATFSRTPKKVDCCNVSIQKNGTINFFCGLIDALEPVWKIDGKPYKE
ncbi:MAG: hypothetical protein ACYSSI_05035 [Planctomycetota bacterium]|jgi:hypothetical protein